MQATDLGASGLNALAELDRGTGAIKKSTFDGRIDWKRVVD